MRAYEKRYHRNTVGEGSAGTIKREKKVLKKARCQEMRKCISSKTVYKKVL